jgi:hypothetical protein
LFGSGGRLGLRLLEEVEDVVLRDAAGDAGALDAGDVDVVLGGDLADERGGLRAAALVEGGDFFVFLGWRLAVGGWRGLLGRAWGLFGTCGLDARGGLVGFRGFGLGCRLRFLLRFRRGCGRRGFRFGRLSLGGDARDDGVHRHGVAFLGEDLGEHARGRRGDLGVDFVGGDLEERLVAIDLVANLLEPLGYGPLGDGLAHLGHYDVMCHGFLLLL